MGWGEPHRPKDRQFVPDPLAPDHFNIRLRCPSCHWTSRTFDSSDHTSREIEGTAWRVHWQEAHTPRVIFEKVE